MNSPLYKDGREILSLFFKLNVWLALLSIFMVGVSAHTLSIPLQDVGLGIYLPFFLVYFVYVRERRLIPDEDRINHPYRTQLVEKYNSLLQVTEVVALLGFELLLIIEIPVGTLTGFGLLILGHLPIVVLYFYDTLKGNPMLDSLIVGIMWAFLMVFTVTVTSDYAFGLDAVIIFISWFMIVFAGVESRNAADIQGDDQTGKQTLAGRLGKTPTKAMEVTLKVIGAIVFWIFGGPIAAVLVLIYLVLLRVCRALTNMATYPQAG